MNRIRGAVDEAIALAETNRLDEAQSLLSEIISFLEDPSSVAKVHRLLGCVRLLKGETEEAIRALERSAKINPHDGLAYLNLCEGLRRAGRLAEAIEAGKRAVELSPDNPMAQNNLGYAQEQAGELEAATGSLRKAIGIQPDYQVSYRNLALSLWRLGRLDEALRVYEKAISLNPASAVDRTNYAGCLLLVGDFERGWEEYEARLGLDTALFPNIDLEKWDGRSSHFDELILVGEQGCGDLILFMRYGRALAGKVARVSIAVPENLIALTASTGIYDRVYTLEEIAHLDHEQSRWFPLLSVPRILGLSRENPIFTDAYVPTDPGRDRFWGERFREDGGLVIGLHWQGNPEAETGSNRGRSFPLESLRPLSTLAGIRFVSLQKGDGAEQLEDCSFSELFVKCQPAVNDTWEFVETASMAKACDLVITSDTALAHLSGAAGAKTWLLLQKIPDWRWGLTGERAPWYPSVRIIRQEKRDDWEGVARRVRADVEELLSLRG